MNQVVVRYRNGSVAKGATNDFLPTKSMFHLIPQDSPPAAKPVEVLLSDLKALFFVKDFTGRPEKIESKVFDPSQPAVGRKIKVVFTDGEVLIGTTQGYQHGRPGFFITPADADSNNSRCYVVTAATKEISFL